MVLNFQNFYKLIGVIMLSEHPTLNVHLALSWVDLWLCAHLCHMLQHNCLTNSFDRLFTFFCKFWQLTSSQTLRKLRLTFALAVAPSPFLIWLCGTFRSRRSADMISTMRLLSDRVVRGQTNDSLVVTNETVPKPWLQNVHIFTILVFFSSHLSVTLKRKWANLDSQWFWLSGLFN